MAAQRVDPNPLIIRLLTLTALGGVAVLTLIDRGATRAYASPWIFLFWFVHLAPLLALILRAASTATPLQLPSRAWSALVAASGGVLLLAALTSPYRGVSLLAALTPLAALATALLVHDGWQRDPRSYPRTLLQLGGGFAAAIVVVSLAGWILGDLLPANAFNRWADVLVHRNDRPLGHANYTAGLAVLALPWLGAGFALAQGFLRRSAWLLAALLAVAMAFTSGSRGGLIGLAALVIATLIQWRLTWRQFALLAAAALVAVAGVLVAHPRTRAMVFKNHAVTQLLAASNVQRSAMADAGLILGRERPLLGWGPGTTPLAYPKVRAQLAGGVENVLQLHNTPVQIWADTGALGVACALVFAWFGWRARGPLRAAPPSPAGALRRAAWIGLLGYGGFALTDYQLDVPVFALAAATGAALLAAPAAAPASTRQRRVVALACVVVLLLVGVFGRRDPAPALNVRALALAGEDPDAAIAGLRASLALNPDQEIAHFNLGWLLVVRDPAAAERHFRAAAQLVPDKGGVYFGLGLALLNQGDRRADATHAFALECVNDPQFLASPWWWQPTLAELRPAVDARVRQLLALARTFPTVQASRPLERETVYLPALIAWLGRRGEPGEILARALTPERVSYFAARPEVPDFTQGPVRRYRRERTAYPVLMRNLDLAPPLDLFDVQESVLATGELAFLFSPKGWLPAPVLLALLNRADPPTP